jgi:hypothetical protein
MLRPVRFVSVETHFGAGLRPLHYGRACLLRLLHPRQRVPAATGHERPGVPALAFVSTESGPKRVVFDVRNGVIPKLFRRHSVALGRFNNPLGESGAD